MRILIAYSHAASGHKSAASAVYSHLTTKTSYDVQIMDCLDNSTPFIRFLYPSVYHFLIKYIPFLWGFLYDVTGIGPVFNLLRPIKMLFDFMTGRGYREYLVKNNFDVIISTHFRPASIAAALKRSGKINSLLISVVTDFDFHYIWKAEGTDAYAVAHSYTKRLAIRNGVHRRLIYITGLPTHRKFEQNLDKAKIKAELGFENEKLTILVSMGFLGSGPLIRIFNALQEYNLIILCGNNKKAYEYIRSNASVDTRVYQIAEKLEELMAASDLIITKPSRQFTSEALVMGITPIFFAPGPGQERHNIRMLDEHHIGNHIRSIRELKSFIKTLASNPGMLKNLGENLKALRRPEAALKIQHLLEGLIDAKTPDQCQPQD